MPGSTKVVLWEFLWQIESCMHERGRRSSVSEPPEFAWLAAGGSLTLDHPSHPHITAWLLKVTKSLQSSHHGYFAYFVVQTGSGSIWSATGEP